jgi:hypothetical protein
MAIIGGDWGQTTIITEDIIEPCSLADEEIRLLEEEHKKDMEEFERHKNELEQIQINRLKQYGVNSKP